MFITDAVMNGFPPHIAQVIAGHRDINVTMGYMAVYPKEAVQAHLGGDSVVAAAILDRRWTLRRSSTSGRLVVTTRAPGADPAPRPAQRPAGGIAAEPPSRRRR